MVWVYKLLTAQILTTLPSRSRRTRKITLRVASMAAESIETQIEGSHVDLVYNRLQTEASSMAYYCVVRIKEHAEQSVPPTW